MAFNIGDHVICIDNERCGSNGLTLGKEYVIVTINPGIGQVHVICDNEHVDNFSETRFQFSKEGERKREIQVGDWVTCINAAACGGDGILTEGQQYQVREIFFQKHLTRKLVRIKQDLGYEDEFYITRFKLNCNELKEVVDQIKKEIYEKS